jgi:hypothetical protein
MIEKASGEFLELMVDPLVRIDRRVKIVLGVSTGRVA